MEEQRYSYITVEVGGIQRYIFATGKLKEMIGASQIIYSVTTSLLEAVASKCGLERVENAPAKGDNWFLVLQDNAGALRILVANEHKAKAFLLAFSDMVQANYPGLPIFATLVTGVAWSTAGLQLARQEASKAIARKRASSPVTEGMPLQPFAIAARLDGLPAVAVDNNDAAISLLSKAKRSQPLLDAATDRLKRQFDASLAKQLGEGINIAWSDDFTELCKGSERARIALIHMDGNDLGKLFQKKSEAPNGMQKEVSQVVRDMRVLSRLVQKSCEQALCDALSDTVRQDAFTRKRTSGTYMVPVRPLLMGGDDITLIVRADLALTFVDAFVAHFEKTTSSLGEPLSIGVGMVIMPASYPFVKAYTLVEELIENAKKCTAHTTANRPSSIDYLVLTGDVEANLRNLRKRIYTANDGSKLICKPYILSQGWYQQFREEALDVLHRLPRSHTRAALESCRIGKASAKEAYMKLLENLNRKIGGRHDQKLMEADRLQAIFGKDNFFDGDGCTKLTDFIELASYMKEGDHA